MEIKNTSIGQVAIIGKSDIGMSGSSIAEELIKIKEQSIPILVVEDTTKITEESLEKILLKRRNIGPTITTPIKELSNSFQDDYNEYTTLKPTEHVPFYKNIPDKRKKKKK